MSNDFSIRVGNNIKKYRKNKDITLKELADKVGLTEATVQKYEAGNIKKIDVKMLVKLSNALDVFPEQLTEWDKSRFKEYNDTKRGREEAQIIKMYSQLTPMHKKAVHNLIENLVACQEKYNSDK